MKQSYFTASLQRSLYALLIEPSSTITEIGAWRKAEVTSWISLLQTVWFLAIAVSIFAAGNPSNTTIVIVLLALTSFSSYILSRTRRYAVSAWALVIIFSVGGFSMMFAQPGIETSDTLLEIIVIAFVIASAVLSARDMFVVVVVNSIVYAVLPLLIPDLKQISFYVTATSAALIGILLGIFSRLRNSVENARLQELRAANQQLQIIQNNLEQMVEDRTSAAETARAEAESARSQTEAHAWFTRGQADLAEKMRGDLDASVLANNVTSFLCQYLGAQTGALFLAKDDKLILTGRYSYTEHPNQKQEFRFGEGLVGETARARRSVSVLNVPEDALVVASALGEKRPNQLLIAPIEADGKVFGVVELGTLNQFSAEHEAFLRRVSESIAIAFRTAQARVQMDELLAQSQRQAEELQAQEEELRATNEELQALAENLKGSPRTQK
jgi:putative methionine-R-sulfoxide reductase with GAF domain